MELNTTKSFELAIYKKGNENSERLMLCLPGRLDTKDYAHMQGHVDYFCERGFLAVSFDPPGTWESPGDISLYTPSNYMQAIDEVISHFGKRPTVVLGHSRGGSTALLATIQNEFITHGIAVMSHWGPSERPDIDADVSISYRDLPPGRERTVERKRFDLPMSYFDDTTSYAGIETCTKPKLFFAGKHDKSVLLDDVREAFALAAEPKEYHELDTEHDYRLRAGIIDEVNRKVEDFLIRN